MRILVCGLPGSGKSHFSTLLKEQLDSDYFNADEVRKEANDWDFSIEGRERQSQRMKTLSLESKKDFVISDFVAPTQKIRDFFNPDFTIWIDTIKEGRFEDTNKIFEKPKYNLRISEYNYDVIEIANLLKEVNGKI